GRESEERLSRSEFESELRKLAARSWKLAGKEFNPRGLIARYTFVSPEGERAGVKLTDVWLREAHVRKADGGWRIKREIWRIYESVPEWGTRR
ncbi:hypothetical protein DRP77_06675, partial [Candidatus Poribacteria bacterium]